MRHTGAACMQVPRILAAYEDLVAALGAQWDVLAPQPTVEADIRGFAQLHRLFRSLCGNATSSELAVAQGTREWDIVWDCWAAATVAALVAVQGVRSETFASSSALNVSPQRTLWLRCSLNTHTTGAAVCSKPALPLSRYAITQDEGPPDCK